MVIQALAPAAPDLVPAQNGGDLAICSAWLRDPNREAWHLFCEFGALGMGAMNGKDGMNTLIHPIEAGCESLPAELIEAKMPLWRKRWDLITDSGGPGKFRGGLSAEAEYEILSDGHLNVVTEKTKASQVQGLFGGMPAPFSNRVTLFPGTDSEVHLGKKSDVHVEPGDVFIMRAAGGGGYGDPIERDPAKVAADVLNEYVSVENAEHIYGVKFESVAGDVDYEATEQLRREMVAERAAKPDSSPAEPHRLSSRT
jgi:N-methylhydantoinase B